MNDTITARQFTLLIASYIQGSLLSMMYYYQRSNHDAWFTLIVAGALFIPCIFLYCKLFNLSGRTSLPGMLDMAFGKSVGKILAILYLIYFVYVASFNLRQTAQFVNMDILVEIPIWVPILFLAAVCWYGSSRGIQFFSATAAAACGILYVLLLLLTVLLFPQIQTSFILPVLRREFFDYLSGTCISFVMPFGELVCMLVLMEKVRVEPRRRIPLARSFLGGFLLGFVFVMIVLLRDVLVLGPFASILSYPAYEVIRFASLGSVITRIETIFDLPFLFILFFRISIQVWCASELLRELVSAKTVRGTSLAVCGAVAICAIILTSSNVALLNKAITWIPLVFLIPQVLIPLCTFLFCLPKRRRSSMIAAVK